MFTYLNSLHGTADIVFLGCAIGGVTLFVLRGLFMLFGGMLGEAGDHNDYDHHDDLEPSFKFLTMHSLTGFMMVFGLLGLGLRQQLDYPFGMALGLAFVAGLFMMLLVAAIFYGASHLTSRGSVFSIQDAVGLPAVVYLRITPDEDGKVQVQIRGVMREIAARAGTGEMIESFVHVKIVRVIDEYTVVVEPLKN